MPVRLAPDAPETLAVEALVKDGCVVLESMVPEDTVEQLARDLGPVLDRAPLGSSGFYGRHTKRIGRLLLRSPVCQELAIHPRMLGLANALLGVEHEASIQLNLTQAIRIEPGEREQYPHKDVQLYPVETRGSEFMINAMWAVDEFTAANGATLVAPGSHGSDSLRPPSDDAFSPVEMAPGSVLVWLGSLWHKGGANKTQTARTGITISYCLGWLRQTENQYLAYPPHEAACFPVPLRELIGYRLHPTNLGWYEGQDPGVLFASDVQPDVLAATDPFSDEIRLLIEDYYDDAEAG